ncbi:hypothetical protein GGR56DRAFT_188828 [Xylariaceae sp. FL0804]|nr:hypothetical protein GGR56DRAFT_188828 [Xylariaceae sp. FL0804]
MQNIGSSPAAHAPTASGNLSRAPVQTATMMASHPTAASQANSHVPPTQPTCQNCSTSTTPLWRRDEIGSVLCNACGLFLKLHGRPRPISLKTDVIKSRNRVKTMRPDMQMKKKQNLAVAANQHANNYQAHDNATVAALATARASQQKPANGHATDSPLSRNATPHVYDPHLTAFQAMDQFQHDGLPQYPMPGGSPGHTGSPLNGDQQSLEIPQTHEQLIATNSSLKTRVSELEVINELYRGRLQQLEQDIQAFDNSRHSLDQATNELASERAQRAESERLQAETQKQLEGSHHRENMLKRRLDEMEQENQENQDWKQKFLDLEQNYQNLKAKVEDSDTERPAKRARQEEPKLDEESELSALQSAS